MTERKSTNSIVGVKRKRNSPKIVLVDLGEQPILEILGYINDTKTTEDQICIYLEILSNLETSIDILKRTKAGICLRKIKKETNDERISLLCKNLLSHYRTLVQNEIDARKQENPKKKRKVVQ